MKQLLLICTFVLLHVMPASADNSQRLVLIEEFTNTGCGPCASWSPTLDKVIYDRLGDCIAIKYHGYYPNPDDPFYLENKESLDSRIAFYGINAYPTTLVNGTEIGERSYNYMDNAISYCAALPANYGLTVSKQVTAGQLSVQASLTPYADVESTNLRLFVAAIEEHLVPATPYPNGETEANYTMRKMLTSAEGNLPATVPLTAGQNYQFESTTALDFMDDVAQLGVVAFLQDITTREILATAYAGPNVEEQNVLKLLELKGTPDHICLPNYYGEVRFRNDGSNAITSATLNVQVNGTIHQYPWTGSLAYLENAYLTFSDFREFTLADSRNEVSVWFSNINGTATVSNTLTSSFSNSVQATYGVQLKIYTDKKPEETTWKLYNSAGDVVREGGPYDEGRKFYTVDFNLTKDDCYFIEFLDAGGDGIKGANGNGYYQLFQVDEAGKTTRITQGDYDGSVYDVFFNLTGTPEAKHRLVLFEEFTNTSCDPCADFSPYLDQTIFDRMGDMVAITYHYNYPSPQDPFLLTNPTDNLARASYYGVTGVPSLRVDGQHAYSYGYEEYLNGYIDGAGETPAQVDIDTEASLADGLLTVNVSLLPKGITDGSNLRLIVAAVEERVEWAEPAANGERSWNYVMRKLLPSADGQPLEASLTQVAPYQYTFTWQVEGYTDPTELGLVTFVQDNSTKQILGTCYTPRPTGSSSAAKILKVLDTPARLCSPHFTSTLLVRNTGRDVLTSANVNVSINGQVQTTPWSGRADYLDIISIQTPDFTTFQPGSSTNEVEIWLSDLNGTAEQSVHKTLAVANAPQAQQAVRLTIMTDNAPEEITWKVYNSAGDVVCEGGPYTEARKRQVHDLPLTVDDCYTLTFTDAGGNGITGNNGRGYYMLHEIDSDGNTRLLEQADYTGTTHETYFSLQNATGITPVTATSQQHLQRTYDLNGRPASSRTRLVITKDKKIINK